MAWCGHVCSSGTLFMGWGYQGITTKVSFVWGAPCLDPVAPKVYLGILYGYHLPRPPIMSCITPLVRLVWILYTPGTPRVLDRPFPALTCAISQVLKPYMIAIWGSEHHFDCPRRRVATHYNCYENGSILRFAASHIKSEGCCCDTKTEQVTHLIDLLATVSSCCDPYAF